MLRILVGVGPIWFLTLVTTRLCRAYIH